MIVGRDKLTTGDVHRGQLYLLTDIDAPRSAHRARRARARRGPRALARRRAGGRGTLDDFALCATRSRVHGIEDVRSQPVLYDLQGKPLGEIALPTRGSVDGLSGDAHGDALAFVFSSFFHPPALFGYDARTRALDGAYQVAHDLDPTASSSTSRACAPRRHADQRLLRAKPGCAATADNPC